MNKAINKSIILGVALDAGNPDADSLLVVPVLVAEEVDEGELFDVDPAAEESPGHDGVDDRADRVAQNDLKFGIISFEMNLKVKKTFYDRTSTGTNLRPFRIEYSALGHSSTALPPPPFKAKLKPLYVCYNV